MATKCAVQHEECVLATVCLCRFGVHRFVRQVNKLLADGWRLNDFSVDKDYFKILCSATFWRDK